MRRMWAQGKVMSELIDSSDLRYAVIEAHWSERPPERFVIAYCNEESLRDVIAAPSIIASGFASRERALAGLAGCLPAATGSKQMSRASAVDRAKEYIRRVHSARRRVGNWLSDAETWKTARRTLQPATAAAILISCSSNIVSATIRGFERLAGDGR